MERDRDADLPEEVMWEGRFITAKKRGRWEYVGRARGIRAAAIIALDADADGTRHVILVSLQRLDLFLDRVQALSVPMILGSRGEHFVRVRSELCTKMLGPRL